MQNVAVALVAGVAALLPAGETESPTVQSPPIHQESPMSTERPSPPESRSGTLETRDGVELWWTIHGSGRDTVVVPGAWILAGPLGPLARDRTLLFYDMRSRGRSERVDDADRLGLDLDVRDLADVRRHFGLERMSLVGFSYLGAVAARYAMERPDRVRRLVLLGSIPPRNPAPYTEAAPGVETFLDPARLERLEEMRSEGVPDTDPDRFCRFYWRTMLPAYTADPEAAGRLAEELDLGCELPNERPEAFGRVLAHVESELETYDWRPEAADLDTPTLVLHGLQDHVAPAEGGREWAGVLPDARFEGVEEAGHLLWAERTDRVLDALDRFLPAGGEPDAGSDAGSPESVVATLYEVISGPADQARDWDRLRSLFWPGASIRIPRRPPEGREGIGEWTVEAFVDEARATYGKNGFWEREIWSRTERFGRIAHVLSTYESRVGAADAEPTGRGINSFQLIRHDGRWWITSILFDVEAPDRQIPERYGGAGSP